jgi:hypothetical protein
VRKSKGRRLRPRPLEEGGKLMFDVFHGGRRWKARERKVVVTRGVNSPRVTVVLVPLVQPHSSPTLFISYPVSLYT